MQTAYRGDASQSMLQVTQPAEPTECASEFQAGDDGLSGLAFQLPMGVTYTHRHRHTQTHTHTSHASQIQHWNFQITSPMLHSGYLKMQWVK